MEPVLIGYFPKKVAIPADFGAPSLKDICSLSTCIAKGPPDGWIDRWMHNEHWLFQTPGQALQVVQNANPSEYSIHAYRMLPLEFDGGEVKAIHIVEPRTLGTPHVDVEPLCGSIERLGFDAVEGREGSFSCSPLSCNGGYKEFETNEHCLVSALPRAIELATIFSLGGWEPGPYRVVEVLAVPPPLLSSIADSPQQTT